jgi:FixJ family two-component response regulator
MEPSNRPVVHVVEDDASARTALVRLLHHAGYDAHGYQSAIEFLVTERPDAPGCIVLDVALPDVNGVELQAVLAKSRDATPIVFLTGCADVETSVRAMKAGAIDFLTKPVRKQALLKAIEEALNRDASERMRDEELRSLRARFARLTAREREVFGHVTHGRLNKQIADELRTSVRTVKAHRAQVMSKMEVASLADLVSAAARLGSAADS